MSASATAKLPPRDPARACRHPALAVRRDLGGAVPHPGLRLRERPERGAALQERRAGLSVFALRQPDRDDVRAAHGRARRRGGRARDRDRHGGGHHRADGPGQGRRSHRGVEGAVRLLPLRGRGPPAALRRRLDAGRRHRSRRSGARRCGRTPRPSSSRARPIRRSRCSTSRRSPRSRTPPARRWWSTTCSRRRCFSARSSSAPTAWSIPPPSTSTARAAASAASSSAPRNSSRTTSTARSARPARRCRRSTPGCCSRGWRRSAVRVRRQTDTAATVAVALAEHPKVSRLIYPGRPDHPQADDRAPADARRLDAGRLRGQGRQGRGLPLPGRAQARAHQQQSRRRQEPDHPSGDHDASAAHAGGARRTRHQRRPGAAVMRPEHPIPTPRRGTRTQRVGDRR